MTAHNHNPDVPGDVNNAFAVLRPLIERLPEAEVELTMPAVAAAWRFIYQSHPSLYASWKHEVRKRCGTLAAKAVDDCVDVGRPNGLDVDIVCAADIAPEEITWLWKGYLARGMLHLLAGAPGTGKTTVALAIGAALTSGGRLPDGTHSVPCGVLMWSGEDDIKKTLLPRFICMGGDVNRMHFVSGTKLDGKTGTFDPARDMGALTATATKIKDLGLLILDPVVQVVAGDSNKNGDVRRGLQPVVELSQRLDAAAFGVSHFTKGSQGKDPIERVTGSLAFAAAARVVFAAAGKNDEKSKTERRFVRAKSNLGPDGGGFTYSLEQMTVPNYPNLEASRVIWGQTLEGSALELLAEPKERGATNNCESWLRELLTEEAGGMESREILRLAERYGFPQSTIYRARDKLKVDVRTTGFGKSKRSMWSIFPALCNENIENTGSDEKTGAEIHSPNIPNIPTNSGSDEVVL